MTSAPERSNIKGERGGARMDEKEKAKKQILLRISPKLWAELAAWAEDDFRSINGQIEYLLTECVKKRKGAKKGPEE